VAETRSAVPVYVNKKSGVGHLDRMCEYLSLVPDGAIYIYHPMGGVIHRRMCHWCAPYSLPTVLPEADHRADVTAS